MNHGENLILILELLNLYQLYIHRCCLTEATWEFWGFVVYGNNKSFYHAGDTALTYDMKLIPKLCPKLDFAILPIGDNFTMGVDEALMASDFIKCKKNNRVSL